MSPLPVIIFALSIVLFIVIQSPLGRIMRPHQAELEEASTPGRPRRRRKDVPPVMQIIISLAILAAAMVIIGSHEFLSRDKHWAYASLGVVLGFWLKE